jgi:hypothetical protein
VAERRNRTDGARLHGGRGFEVSATLIPGTALKEYAGSALDRLAAYAPKSDAGLSAASAVTAGGSISS